VAFLGMSAGLDQANLTVRLARDDEADATFRYALFAAARASETPLMPVDPAARDFLLGMQFRSMNATYRRDYPLARWEIVELAGAPVGLLVTDVGDARVTFVDIAFSPEVQGRGLATAVMTRALEEPRRLGLPAEVNVLAQNVASLRLCERLGFVKVEEAPPFVRLEWRS
jgi:ribosomal protein S18 acetylase RimI-like enzyme